MNLAKNILLGLCTLTVVVLGLSVVGLVLFWPLLLWLALYFCTASQVEALTQIGFFVAVVAIQIAHTYMLYTDSHHLKTYRFLLLPIRRLLVPVVVLVTRLEAIREGCPTLFWDCVPPREGDVSEIVLQSMRGKVRQHYKRLRRVYAKSGLRHKTLYAEETMELNRLLPVLWNHEKRVSPDNTVEEFIKRFLVVTLLPDGVLDIYMNDQNAVVAFTFCILQRSVLQNFMYFCVSEHSKSAIWYHAKLLALCRGQRLQVSVNDQVHQTLSKRQAGLNSREADQDLSRLYPFQSTVSVPLRAAKLRVWDD